MDKGFNQKTFLYFRITDQQFQQKKEYIESDAFEAQKTNMQIAEKEALDLETELNNKGNRDEKNALINLKKSLVIDQNEVNNTYMEYQKYLKLSLQ